MFQRKKHSSAKSSLRLFLEVWCLEYFSLISMRKQYNIGLRTVTRVRGCFRYWNDMLCVFTPWNSPYLEEVLGKCIQKERMTQHWLMGNSQLLRSRSKRTRETGTYKRSSEKEQKRRKIDRCQEGAGLGVTEMGLIPPPIPAAFLLFEVTSGLNFPRWLE